MVTGRFVKAVEFLKIYIATAERQLKIVISFRTGNFPKAGNLEMPKTTSADFNEQSGAVRENRVLHSDYRPNRKGEKVSFIDQKENYAWIGSKIFQRR